MYKLRKNDLIFWPCWNEYLSTSAWQLQLFESSQIHLSLCVNIFIIMCTNQLKFGIPEKLDSGHLASGRLDVWTLDAWILDPWTLDVRIQSWFLITTRSQTRKYYNWKLWFLITRTYLKKCILYISWDMALLSVVVTLFWWLGKSLKSGLGFCTVNSVLERSLLLSLFA